MNQIKSPFIKDRLFCPGPVEIPLQFRTPALSSSIYHRSEMFYELFLECRKLLSPIFGSKDGPLILTSSGTGAMESAITNFTSPQDQILVVNGGKFGERWGKIASAYQCQVEELKLNWGTSLTQEMLLNFVKKFPQAKAIYLQSHETSTGVLYELEKLIPTIRSTFSGLIIVDAISSLCAHPMKMDEWGIDIVIGGSQKGFAIPPGLSFIALSEKALQNFSNRPRFYFDLRKEKKEQDEGSSAFTPAISLVQQLYTSLKQIHQTGLEKYFSHHQLLGDAVRAAASGLGLELFPEKPISNILTAMKIPMQIDGSKVVRHLRTQHGIIMAGGQDQLKGKIIRFSQLGYIDQIELIGALGALELTLKKLHHPFELGSGIKEALKIFNQNH